MLCNLAVTDGKAGADDVPPGIRSVDADAWREAFYAGAKPGVTASAKRKAFTRATDTLIDDLHLVGMAGGRVWPARISPDEAAHLGPEPG